MAFNGGSYGFRHDMEDLFSRLLTADPSYDSNNSRSKCLRFSRFCKIWRQMQFHYVFSLRLNRNDLRDFIEQMYSEVLTNVCGQWSLGRRIAAMYLLYALFVKQPKAISQSIRITEQSLRQIKQLIAECKASDQLEICYLWRKLWTMGAIDIVYSVRDFSPQYSNTIRICGQDSNDWLYKNLMNRIDPGLQIISEIHERYSILKSGLKLNQTLEVDGEEVQDIYDDSKRLRQQIMENCKLKPSNEFEKDITKMKKFGNRRMAVKDGHGDGNGSLFQIVRNHNNKHKINDDNCPNSKRRRGRPRLK